MPKLSKSDLREQLRLRQLERVYVLFGSETFLRGKALRKISETVFRDGDFRDFNESIFSLNDPANIKDALAAADQLPMMAEKRIVVVTDVKVGATSTRDTLKEEFEPILSGYLADPSPSTVLIFVADELNGNRKITKSLSKSASIVEFEPLEGEELYGWIKRLFKDAGVTAELPEVRYLASISNSSLIRISNDIKKLAAASMPEGLLTKELIDSLVPRTREVGSFAFTDHLLGGRSSDSIASLELMLSDGAEPLMLLGLLGSNYRRLIIAKDMMANGAARSDVARAIRLPYHSQEQFLGTARRSSFADLVHAVERISETDLVIKSSAGGGVKGAQMHLEMLVCELAAAV